MSDWPVFPRGCDGGTAGAPSAFSGVALAFEFVNGFHDTANAVATVIYTNALKPRTAVVLSGICNFVGVHLGGRRSPSASFISCPSICWWRSDRGPAWRWCWRLLCAAIVWNFGTWYLGLPASSSHTLIGSILGIGLTNAALQGRSPGAGVNWGKAGEVMASLLISPVLGFLLAARPVPDRQAIRQQPAARTTPHRRRAAAPVDPGGAGRHLLGGERGSRLQRRPERGRADHADPDRPLAGPVCPQPRLWPRPGRAGHPGGRPARRPARPPAHRPPTIATFACASFSTTCETP